MTSLALPKTPAPWNGNYTTFGSKMRQNPTEGDKTVPFPIAWGTDDNAQGSIAFNMNGRTTQPFSQIGSVYVDNILCGSDVQIIFPDTQFKLDIPAFSNGYYPVTTNALQFFVVALNAVAGDQTFLQVLNFMPNPVSISQVVFNSASTPLGPVSFGALSPQIVVNKPSLVLYGVNLNVFGVTSAGNGEINFSITDGNDIGFFQGSLAFPAAGGTIVRQNIIDMPPGANVKITGPLKVAWSTSGAAFGAGSAFEVNAIFRPT